MTVLGVRLTFWRAAFAVIMAAGLYVTYLRFFHGLGVSTNMNDQFPWGIWIGFDVLCGVGLAAGGFTLAAIVHIFHIHRYEPIVRPAILTAFLGYLLVVVGLIFDLGKPWNLWHPIIMWNPRSVMFEVAWCVTLYSTVLFLEFLPMVFERFRLERARRILRAVMIPIVVAGVLLSTLHQSSLGTMFLIVPQKMHALWYSPLLPLLFYISAIAVGLAMTIFESWHSSRAFGRALEFSLVQRLGRILAVVIAVYLTIRLLDLRHRGAFTTLSEPGAERWLFGLEMVLMAVPMLLLFRERTRQNPFAMYFTAVVFLFGFVVNRLNVTITSMERSAGGVYIPKWTEVVITLTLVAAGFAAFRLAAQYLPVFEEESHGAAQTAAPRQGDLRVPVLARGD
jgi:Ni/Fe-hydrogenase subunit HybB-like protein